MNSAAQRELTFTPRVSTPNQVFIHARAAMIRRSECVILGFLIYAAALGALLPVPSSVANLVLLLNLSILAAYGWLIFANGSNPSVAFRATRDVMSLALIVLAYREMGWFAQPHFSHNLETLWISWDRVLLRGGARAVIETLGPVVPSILEMSYGLVYALAPLVVVMLYIYHRQESTDEFLVIFAVAVLLCYAQFPFWPSDPPRVVFPGQDLPSYPTLFRSFNLWMLGNYGIHTSVFPSAHVAGAFAAAFGALRTLPGRPWVGRLLLMVASLIALATVYGRYHYLADALAGLLMALSALAIATLIGTRSAAGASNANA